MKDSTKGVEEGWYNLRIKRSVLMVLREGKKNKRKKTRYFHSCEIQEYSRLERRYLVSSIQGGIKCSSDENKGSRMS